MFKKMTALLLAALCFFSLTGFTAAPSAETVSIETVIREDTRFGFALADLSREELEAAGFQLGDSVDLVFAGGLILEDVPYFDGFYVQVGEPVAVSYPGVDILTITYNSEGIWKEEGLTEGEAVTITLREAGAYASVQETLSLSYSCLREDYASDESFCNFRALSGGALKEGLLYRGTTPVDNSRGRAAYTDALLKQNGIRLILDLADSEEELAEHLAAEDFNSPYALSLYEEGNLLPLALTSDFPSQAYSQKVVTGLREICRADGPIYIHCTEGKDRAGFVSMLLEALAGASYEELRADYMTTYRNYYGVSAEETPEKYEAIAELYFDAFCDCLLGEEDLPEEELQSASYAEAAAAYLAMGGMTEAEIAALTEFITE